MVDVMTPVIDPGRDAFVSQNPFKQSCVSDGVFFPQAQARTDDDVAASVGVQIVVVLKVFKIIHR
jgi:hypothetical protein